MSKQFKITIQAITVLLLAVCVAWGSTGSGSSTPTIVDYKILYVSTSAFSSAPSTGDLTKEVKSAMKEGEAATSSKDRGAADWDFFEAQVAMSGNAILALLANAMRQVYEQNPGLFEVVYAAPDFDTSPHRRILAAIADREPGTASMAMEDYGRSVLPGGAL